MVADEIYRCGSATIAAPSVGVNILVGVGMDSLQRARDEVVDGAILSLGAAGEPVMDVLRKGYVDGFGLS